MTDFPIYTSRDLYGVMYDRRHATPSNYWLNLCFPGSHMSTREEIVFEKLVSKRQVAAFTRPTSQGKASYTRQGSGVQTFRPAYIKPKDKVVPAENLSRQPGDLFTLQPRTPQQNFDAEVVNITQHHRSIIMRRWEWMAAQAAIYGEVTIDYDDAPSVTLDFGRAAGHDVTLGVGDRWGDSGVSIIDNVQSWLDTMADADFGGMGNRLTIGTSVWGVMRADEEVIDEMSTQRRGNTELNIQTGLVESGTAANNYSRYVGSLKNGLDVYVYADKYQDASGTFVPFMDPRDVVLTGPGVEGVKAFGAIVDAKAGLQPIDIFTKMWDEDDPSGRFIMSQSAPLMIPVNPNCTLRARVLA